MSSRNFALINENSPEAPEGENDTDNQAHNILLRQVYRLRAFGTCHNNKNNNLKNCAYNNQ